jgi:DNA-binding YbaB/EbfC family protein
MFKMENILKQSRELKAKLEEIQEGLAEKKVEATSGGGMVKVVANGRQEILEIKIEKELVEAKDIEMLEDLILAAVNEARKKANDLATREMRKVSGSLDILNLFT